MITTILLLSMTMSADEPPPIRQSQPPVVKGYRPNPQPDVAPTPTPKVSPTRPADAIQLQDGSWVVPHPTIPGYYTPWMGKESVSPRPFRSRPSAVVSNTTLATGAPTAGYHSTTYPGTTRMVLTTTPVVGAGRRGSINCDSGG